MNTGTQNAFGPSEFGERVGRGGGGDSKVLRGFTLGRSPDDGKWRLYLNAELSHYLEFDSNDTIHAEELKPGRTMVWVRRGARVTETISRTLPVEFLQGQIRTGFMRGIVGLTGVHTLQAEGCPCSGCAHCTVSCSSLPGGDSVGLSCGC